MKIKIKIKLKLTIRKKFLLAFSIIFFAGFFTLSPILNVVIDKNNQSTIYEKLKEAKKTTDFYLSYSSYSVYNYDNSGLFYTLNNIAQQTSGYILMYSPKKKIIAYSSMNKSLINNLPYKKEFNNAIKNHMSYTIIKTHGKVFGSLSYHLRPDINNRSILRIVEDYSKIYASSDYILSIVQDFAIILFIIVFILFSIISKKITIPLEKLSKASNDIAKGNFDADIAINSSDEIGTLSQNFSKMMATIKTNIKTIENDRNALYKLEQHRKIFLDNVTHELKTPLTTILGFSQIIYEKGYKDEAFVNYGIEHIIKETQRLHKMVVDLLELSKLNSNGYLREYSMENISLLLRETAEEMSIKAKKYGIQIELNIEENITAWVVANEIKEVFINIIDNSIKYGNTNSEILIEGKMNAPMADIYIRDEGMGISSDKIDKIFEPFFRADKDDSREKGSSGLGLALSKSIIEKHNGTIEITSIGGKGTVVHIALPTKNVTNI